MRLRHEPLHQPLLDQAGIFPGRGHVLVLAWIVSLFVWAVYDEAHYLGIAAISFLYGVLGGSPGAAMIGVLIAVLSPVAAIVLIAAIAILIKYWQWALAVLGLSVLGGIATAVLDHLGVHGRSIQAAGRVLHLPDPIPAFVDREERVLRELLRFEPVPCHQAE